jgi:hypothetical protein
MPTFGVKNEARNGVRFLRGDVAMKERADLA